MPGSPGAFVSVPVAVAGLGLTLVYFAVGLGVYLYGHRHERDALGAVGRSLVRLSPLPLVFGLVLAVVAPRSRLLFFLGGATAVLVVLAVPALAVVTALDRHAVGD